MASRQLFNGSILCSLLSENEFLFRQTVLSWWELMGLVLWWEKSGRTMWLVFTWHMIAYISDPKLLFLFFKSAFVPNEYDK